MDMVAVALGVMSGMTLRTIGGKRQAMRDVMKAGRRSGRMIGRLWDAEKLPYPMTCILSSQGDA